MRAGLRKPRRGVAMVEFALVGPLTLLLIFAIIQIGLMFNAFASITNLAREAARVGVMDYTLSDAHRNQRIEQMVTAEYDQSWLHPSGFSYYVGELSSPNPITVTYTLTDPANPSRSGQPLTVTVSYDFKLAFGIVEQIPPFRIVSSSTMRIE